MPEYNIKHYDQSNFPVIIGLCLGSLFIPIIGLTLYAVAESKNPFFTEYGFILMVICIFLFTGIIILLAFYSIKKYQEKKEKLMHIIINEEYININNGEKYIYFNTIFGLNLEDKMMYNQGMHIKYAMELFILHNTSDEFKLGIMIGDKKNEEIFYEFYNEVKKRYENTKNII